MDYIIGNIDEEGICDAPRSMVDDIVFPGRCGDY